MTKNRYAVALALASAIWLTAPAAAQQYDGAVGYGAGAIAFTDFNAGGNGRTFRLDAGWVAVANLEQWVAGGHVGYRVNGAVTQRPMETSADTRSIRLWMVGGDLMLRARGGTSPFVTGGLAGVHYGFGSGPEVILPAEQAVYSGDSKWRLALSVGGGLDLVPGFDILGTPAAFRIEAMDHVVLDSPFDPISGGDFDPVHNLRLTFSILGLIDLRP